MMMLQAKASKWAHCRAALPHQAKLYLDIPYCSFTSSTVL